jgi:hypothetical protein
VKRGNPQAAEGKWGQEQDFDEQRRSSGTTERPTRVPQSRGMLQIIAGLPSGTNNSTCWRSSMITAAGWDSGWFSPHAPGRGSAALAPESPSQIAWCPNASTSSPGRGRLTHKTSRIADRALPGLGSTPPRSRSACQPHPASPLSLPKDSLPQAITRNGDGVRFLFFSIPKTCDHACSLSATKFPEEPRSCFLSLIPDVLSLIRCHLFWLNHRAQPFPRPRLRCHLFWLNAGNPSNLDIYGLIFGV